MYAIFYIREKYCTFLLVVTINRLIDRHISMERPNCDCPLSWQTRKSLWPPKGRVHTHGLHFNYPTKSY